VDAPNYNCHQNAGRDLKRHD
jgi:hypothetical protein